VKVIVLGGGDSPERNISLRSAEAVSVGLTTAGFETVDLDPIDLNMLDTIEAGAIVFPILHGKNGEDGVIQKALEARNLSYLGSDSKSSEACFDKWTTRLALEKAGLPIARGEHVDAHTYETSDLRSEPHVLKAVGGGSSIGTYIVHDPSRIDVQEIKKVFAVSDKAVVEELVEGVEITVPVLDNHSLPVIEIKPPENEEFDYRNKYNGKTQELCPPVSIDQAAQRLAQEYALRAHKTLRCRHLSRIDMIIRPDGGMVLLEINTIPGMTDQSLYPKSAKTAGIEFPELMSRFVEMVKRDYGL
jgi:D-alanine-D-alanine ligase